MGPYGELRKAFPISLTPDTVYANASWEFVSHWNKDTSSIYLLKFALDYLACIANGCLRHGRSKHNLYILLSLLDVV